MQYSTNISTLRTLLLLQNIPGLGCSTINKLIRVIKNITTILSYSKQQLISLGLNSEQINYIISPNWEYVDKQFAIANKNNIEIISILDSDYPALLKQIYDPPIVLYIKGNKNLLSSKQIGVVGTRKPTLYGKQMADYFSRELLSYGYIITSGFAIGIDIIAHLAAVNRKLPTVVVLGASLDCIYPANHKKYINKIIEYGGVIISENRFTTTPHPSCFPRRNRIISGLSSGVLVVEAARKSGSLITARCGTRTLKRCICNTGKCL